MRLCRTPAAAIFVTHFYGLPQPVEQIAALARRHGMRLIEDVSHGLYSRTADDQALGSFGEMAVFSLWKSLAVPDGGVLRLRPDATRLPLPLQGERAGAASAAGRLRHMMEETLATQHPAAVRAVRRRLTDPLINGLKRRLAGPPATASSQLESDRSLPPEAAQLAFRPERGAWRMTALATHLLPRLCRDDLVDQRRANYRHIVERLLPGTAVQVLVPALPALVAPLFLPLVAADPRPFCRHLASHGVGFFRGWCVFHPAVAWQHFPREVHLKEHVVVVPVHQGLSEADLARIIWVVNEWNLGREGGDTAPAGGR